MGIEPTTYALRDLLLPAVYLRLAWNRPGWSGQNVLLVSRRSPLAVLVMCPQRAPDGTMSSSDAGTSRYSGRLCRTGAASLTTSGSRSFSVGD